MATQPSYQIKTVVGRNIAAARSRKGLTQHEVASLLNTSVSRVSGWERGVYMPRNTQAVADALFDGDLLAMFREPAETEVAA